MTRLTDDELIELFDKQLPALLERRPELEPRIYRAFIKTFAMKEEIAAVLAELRDAIERSFYGKPALGRLNLRKTSWSDN